MTSCDTTKKSISTVCLLALLAGSCIADGAGQHADKQPIKHSHHNRPEFNNVDLKARDAVKRNIVTFLQYETVYVDQNGKPISTALETAVPQAGGYENLVIPGSPLTMAEESIPTSSPASAPEVAPAPDPAPAPAPAPVAPPADVSYGGYEKSGSTKPPSGGSGGGDYEDGSLDCSEFPSQYGAVPLDHLNWGGWSGIQIDNRAGESCTEGAYCSYACPPGQTKSQWPANQPADGQTRGGLQCKGNKLRLTRPSVKKLCTDGYGSAVLVNKMSSGVAVCGTDYPGSENMVVPSFVGGGAETPLTVIDSANCFIWQGKPTTAQYYVNKLGVSMDDGCRWGDKGSKVGNWAPLVFGAGHSEAGSFISLFANPESKNGAECADAGYDVEIVPDDGAVLNGACAYRNNQFYSGKTPVKDGCTVTVVSGKGKYVFTSRK